MTEVNRRYFESLMADQQLSLRGLARKMDMSHSQLSLAFSGARRLTVEEVAKLSQIFGEPLNRIVENAGVTVRPVNGRRISVIGAMRGDGTVEEYGLDVTERTDAPEDLPENSVAVQCRTAGSPLDWMDSWILFCRAHNGVDPTILGRLCLLKIKGGPSAIASVRRGYRDGAYNLFGPYPRENAILDWATPVIVTRN